MEIPATRPGKFPTPTVAWERPDDPAQPLVILLHGSPTGASAARCPIPLP